MDKEVTKKINTIKKTNALEKKEFIKSFEKKQLQSREVTKEIQAQYNKQVADLKCHYEKILLKNDEDLAALKKFKNESDLLTGQLMFDADVKLKRELDRLSKQHESKSTKTQQDLKKDHLREIERMKKNHHGEIEKASNKHLREIEKMKKQHVGELKKAANLVERLRREKRNKRNVMTKRLKNSSKKKVR